jgi:signal transduction histidine kinase
MNIILEFFRDIIEFISNHPLVIKGVTGIAAGCCAAVILFLRKESVSAERWAKYFGGAFLIYATEYSLQFVIGYVESHRLSSGYGQLNASEFVRYIAVVGSSANNLLFLAAAFALLNRKPFFPWWAWIFATFALVGVVDESICRWCRIPDAIFSAISLGAIGYATFINVSFRRRRVLATIALGIAGLYTLIQIGYGFNPFLVSGDFPWALETASAFTGKSNPSSILRTLDAFAIALVLPLKFGLFFIGLVLLMRAIVVVSSNTARKMLHKIVNGRLDYLSNEGIVTSIGQALDADTVELSLRLPSQKDERIALFGWDREPPTIPPQPAFEVRSRFKPGQRPSIVRKPMIRDMPSAEDTVVGMVLKKGCEIKYPGRHQSPNKPISHISDIEDNTSLVAVPIFYHGSVIGCLSAEWRTTGAFNATAAQHMREWADLLSPAVQSYRELAALDQLSYRFTRWQVEQEALENESSIHKIIEILHDILSPLATGIIVDFGFQSFRITCGDNDIYTGLLEEKTADGNSGLINVVHQSDQAPEILPSMLVVTQKGSGDKTTFLEIGEVAIVVPSQKDEIAFPILGTNDFHRRTMGALVADNLLDIAREHLGSVLKDLGVKLNRTHQASESHWLQDIEVAAKKAGLLWATATYNDEDGLSGSPEWKDLVQKLPAAIYEVQNLEEPVCISLNPPIGETYHIVSIHLPITAGRIWFGIGRKGFGPELSFPSPWKVFLERFAEIADSALVRLAAAREFQGLQMRVMKAQGLATVAATTETLFHQLTNLVRDIVNPISTLRDALRTRRLEAKGELGELILSMGESTEYLLKFASEIKSVTKMDSRRPCPLLQAAKQSEKLYSLALTQSGINLEIDLDSDLVVDVPFYVVSLALANLVENATDALKGVPNRNGALIRIEAEENGEMINCHVTDNGPGIHPSLLNNLFDLGVTTKQDSGGWGLYLIKHSLLENGADLSLTNPGPGTTRFTIRFPKRRQEDSV